MGCSPSKDSEYVEGTHTLMIPAVVPLDRLFFYLVSGQFHSDLARVMTSDGFTGSWEREASAAVSEKEREREGYRHSILSLENTSPDLIPGCTYSLLVRADEGNEVDSAYIYKVMEYEPSAKVAFAVTSTSEADDIIHERVTFSLDQFPNGTQKLVLNTHIATETDAVGHVLRVFSPLNEHLHDRALVHMLCIKTALKKIVKNDVNQTLTVEAKSEEEAEAEEDEAAEDSSDDTPPPGPIFSLVSEKTL